MKADEWSEMVGVEPDCGDCIHLYCQSGCALERDGLDCEFEGVMAITDNE